LIQIKQTSSASAFLRAKLGGALRQRSGRPHIYESAEEVRLHLRELQAGQGRTSNAI
jgi:hypothetical protein